MDDKKVYSVYYEILLGAFRREEFVDKQDAIKCLSTKTQFVGSNFVPYMYPED